MSVHTHFVLLKKNSNCGQFSHLHKDAFMSAAYPPTTKLGNQSGWFEVSSSSSSPLDQSFLLLYFLLIPQSLLLFTVIPPCLPIIYSSFSIVSHSLLCYHLCYLVDGIITSLCPLSSYPYMYAYM